MSYILCVALSISYFLCGYILGFHQGYVAGDKDSVYYTNTLLEGDK